MKQSLRTVLTLVVITLFSTTGLFAQKDESVSPDKAGEYLQNGEWDKAAKALKMITAKQPENSGAWFQMGYALHAMGEYDKAIEAYSTTLEIGSPLSPMTMYNMGCAYALKGNTNMALSWLNKSVDAGFNQAEQIKIDTDLESLRSMKEFESIVEGVDRNARPCTYLEEAQDLDFWIGDWNVYNQAGQLAGKNKIENILEDCVIYENWSGTLGMSGKSFSSYDSSIKKWRQTWVDDKGGTILSVGEIVNGAMVFERESTDSEGITTLTQMILTPTEDGEVKQRWQSSTDNGKNWTAGGELTYTPVEQPKEKSGS